MPEDKAAILRTIEEAAKAKERFLNLSHIELTTLPPEITRFTNLTKLYLGVDQLTTLPPEIGKLTNLTRLHLRVDQLTTLSPEIGLLTNLTLLGLFGSQLTTLPPEIGKLANLTSLDLSFNQLTTLPPEIGKLANLTSLDLSFNQLTTLPPEIGLLTNLKSLGISDNPLQTPPPEIVAQGAKAIVAYCRERLRESKPQWISKLLVVGEPDVGKTSLLRSLRGQAFDPSSSSTRGIQIQELLVPHPTKDVTMRLFAWDFGGQEIYHATHYFFLSNRSLFVLVCDGRQNSEQGRLTYWLDAIRARAPESPVLLVGTHGDERSLNLPLGQLRQRYPQIQGYWKVSNRTGEGLEPLRAALAEAASSLPLMGEEWPANWIEVSKIIEAGDLGAFISPMQLKAVMAKCDVRGDIAGVLTQYLHDLGLILYYKDDPDLNTVVILQPQWVSQAISRVLDSDRLTATKGIFTREHMETIWEDIEPHLREHLLRLMRRFDLSYPIEDQRANLVVERLPLDPPEYESTWEEVRERQNCLELAMNYRLSTIPAGVPSWFIAREHRFSTQTHWRHGALFADADRRHWGLIRVFPDDRTVRLAVRGPFPQNFFALLKDGLEVTLDRFQGLKIERKVPCSNARNGCHAEFDYSDLQKALDRTPPRLQVRCHGCDADVSVTTLLLGLESSTENAVLMRRLNEMERENAKRHNKMERENAKRHKESLAKVDCLREYTQREFTNSFHREQSLLESQCPNVFILRPGDSRGWIRDWFSQALELHLYCQEPGCWHPTINGGRYEIVRPAEWLRAMTPHLRKLITVLKIASPLIGPWLGELVPNYEVKFEREIEWMKELVDKLPEIEDSSGPGLPEHTGGGTFATRADGASLRALRKLLDEEDSHQHWGGLKPVLTPERHLLWLCEYHADLYK